MSKTPLPPSKQAPTRPWNKQRWAKAKAKPPRKSPQWILKKRTRRAAEKTKRYCFPTPQPPLYLPIVEKVADWRSLPQQAEGDVEEADDDNMEEIDTTNIVDARTRGKNIDFAQAAKDLEDQDDEDDEDDDDFEDDDAMEE